MLKIPNKKNKQRSYHKICCIRRDKEVWISKFQSKCSECQADAIKKRNAAVVYSSAVRVYSSITNGGNKHGR